VNSALTHGDARVTVGRWVGTYLVPASYPAPQDLQRRADRIAAECLAASCGTCLEQALNAADTTVWRIRNLAVNLSLEVGSSDSHDIARDWGRRLATEIYSTVEQGEQSDCVLYFPSKAAFVAQFIFDLATGRAWGKWYYEEFEDLHVLSERQAICAVLLRGDLLPTEAILQLVSTGRLETVLLALNDSDARVIYDSCFESTAVSPRDNGLDKWTGIVLELWNAAPLRAASRDENRYRDALRLFGRTLSRFPAALGDIRLKLVIDGLLEFRRVFFVLHSPQRMDSLIKDLASGNFQSAVSQAIGGGASDPNAALSFFAERMQGDANWGAQAVAVILGESNRERFLTSKTISEGESFLSLFAGVFLLGPSFEALRLDELTNAAANPSETPEKTTAILRHFAALKCLGQIRFADASDDPALRLFSGFEGHSFRQALENVDARQLKLAGAQRMLLQTLKDREQPHQPLLFAELVSLLKGGAVFILRDLARDEWLDIVPVSAVGFELAGIVQASLQRFSSIWESDRAMVFLSDSLSSRMDPSELNLAAYQVVVLDRSNDVLHAQLAGQLGVTREQLVTRLSSSERHYPYFCVPRNGLGFELVPVLDCTFSLISRAVLKNFARRLIGFDASSPDHLYQNFLSGLGEVRRIEQRLEVRLPASPLSLILRMAGLQERKFVPTWLKGLEVWLLPPQE
jgi:hypothetical protein